MILSPNESPHEFPHESANEPTGVVWAIVVLGIAVGLRGQATSGTTAGESPAGADRAFVEVKVLRTHYFVGETIGVRIRFGIERTFLEKNVLQAFQSTLAVPAQLLAPWWENLPGTSIVLDPPPAGRDRATFVCNGKVAFAHRTQIDRPRGVEYTVLEISRTFRTERVGALLLRAPELGFRYATKFRDDFINGRIAEDSANAVARGPAIQLTVRSVPADGRPAGFTGGVGVFTIRALVSRREVTVGEALELVLRIAGDGNLSSLGAPALADLAGFHVRGVVDDRGSTVRTITYDLKVMRGVLSVPKMPFAFFDPGNEAQFRTVYTEAIPLVVRPLPPGATLEVPGANTEPKVAGKNDIFDIKRGAAPANLDPVTASSIYLLFVLLALPWLAAVGLRSWLRARRAQRQPHRVRARGAAATYRSRVIESGEDTADALVEYLAARLHVPASAVIRDDLPAKLERAGVSPDLAADAANLLHDLVAVRYGGAAAAGGVAAAGAIVDELEHELERELRSPGS